MKVTVFSTKPYDKEALDWANVERGHELVYLEERLAPITAKLADGSPGICAFVNDVLNAEVLRTLAAGGTSLIAMRCAGFNNVDLACADDLGLTVARVPAYSPYAVAEHTVALMMALNRKTHRAYNRVREGNFSLNGLMGRDFNGHIAGIIGTGKIGEVVAKILNGLGLQLLAYDLYKNPECEKLGVRYVELEELFRTAEIITLHCPLTPETHHLINDDSLRLMKHGVAIINTSRGALIDTAAAIRALKSGNIGHLGLDVYEEEEEYFMEDLSGQIIQDDKLMRLLTFPNVVITAHQGFFTQDAMQGIARTTLENIDGFEQGTVPEANLLRRPRSGR
jgi:D-lactate dehydrogenase